MERPPLQTQHVVSALELRFRGPGRRSLGARSQKVSKKSRKSLPGPGPKSPKKVSKKVRKVKKKSENGFSETFRTFFETFFRTFWLLAWETFSRLFRDFLAFGPETPSPRSTEPQNLTEIRMGHTRSRKTGDQVRGISLVQPTREGGRSSLWPIWRVRAIRVVPSGTV